MSWTYTLIPLSEILPHTRTPIASKRNRPEMFVLFFQVSPKIYNRVLLYLGFLGQDRGNGPTG